MKVQARMEDKVRIKNLKSLLAFFEKFSRDTEWDGTLGRPGAVPPSQAW